MSRTDPREIVRRNYTMPRYLADALNDLSERNDRPAAAELRRALHAHFEREGLKVKVPA